MKKRTVTEAEMRAHIAAWPRPLARDVAYMYEPPVVTFNDFTLGPWPESVVASHTTGNYLDAVGNRVLDHDADWTIYRELP